jgi:hypothetical protein
MKKNPASDLAILEEATDALVAAIGPAKTARFLAQTRIGRGNYLAIKERLFGRLSVSEIAKRIQNQSRMRIRPASKRIRRASVKEYQRQTA